VGMGIELSWNLSRYRTEPELSGII